MTFLNRFAILIGITMIFAGITIDSLPLMTAGGLIFVVAIYNVWK